MFLKRVVNTNSISKACRVTLSITETMKIKTTTILILTALLTLSTAGCHSSATDQEQQTKGMTGEVAISGAFALYPLVIQWSHEFMKDNPRLHIDVSAGGAGKGVTDVIVNMTDFGMLSRELDDAERAKGVVPFAVAMDAVVADMNSSSPYAQQMLRRGLTREKARLLWDGSHEHLTWGDLLDTDDPTPIHVYTRSDACGAAETWASFFGLTQEDLVGTAVYGDPGIAAAIQKDPAAIGFNNIAYAYDATTRKPNEGLLIIPIDFDESGSIEDDERFYDSLDTLMNAISTGAYAAPPARMLYLVSKGSPRNPGAKSFLRFVLERGQSLNAKAGYVALSEERIAEELQRLDTHTESL